MVDKRMKFFLVILLILFGGFLSGLTSNSLGRMGNNIMHILGMGCILGAIFIVRRKRGKQ
jgi:hypothetical protein